MSRLALVLVAAVCSAGPSFPAWAAPASETKLPRTAAAAHRKKPDPRKGRAQRERDRRRDKGGREREPAVAHGQTAPRVVEDPNDPRERRIAELRGHLDQILRERPLGRARVGVAVLDARDGDVLYAHDADKLFNPASNTKILTTAAALQKLGGNFRYPTRLVGPAADEEGVIHGDVELRGSGDPSLGTKGLAEIARDLAARGIVRIEGDLLADGKYRDADHPNEALGGGALVLNRNVFVVRVEPTESKKPARMSVEPLSPEYFTVENGVTTVARRKTRLRIDAYHRGGRLVVVARGRINPRSHERRKMRLGDGALYAAAVLKRALLDYGIELTGAIRSGGLPGNAPVLAEHQSGPLSDICRISNKDSNNFVADQIFKTLGRECYGGAATLDKGQKAVLEWLQPLGVPSDRWRIVNGSGLTYENRVQALGLAQLLRHLYLDLQVAPEFVTSLAIGGIDGTIRGRFGGGMAGRVRAKTGTLSNVSALSGYVGDKGDVLVFSILVEAFHHRRIAEVRAAQARLVREMMAFLRLDEAGGGPPPALPTPVEGGEDESDADVEQAPGGAAEAGGN